MKKGKSKKEGTRDKQLGTTRGRVKASPFPSELRWLLLLVGLAVSGAATYFVLTTYIWPPIPDTIAGTWQVKGGEMDGTRMTFQRDGTFSSMVTIDGRDIPIVARVALHDKILQFTIATGPAGREETKTQTIRSLTESEMIVEEGGATSTLVRVK